MKNFLRVDKKQLTKSLCRITSHLAAEFIDKPSDNFLLGNMKMNGHPIKRTLSRCKELLETAL